MDTDLGFFNRCGQVFFPEVIYKSEDYILNPLRMDIHAAWVYISITTCSRYIIPYILNLCTVHSFVQLLHALLAHSHSPCLSLTHAQTH